MKIIDHGKIHEFDISVGQTSSLDLLVEELPESVFFGSDCASSGSSVSTASTLGCGSFSSASSFSSMGSVTSSGG